MTKFIGQVTEFTTRSVDGEDVYTFRRLPLGGFTTIEVRFELGTFAVWVPLKSMHVGEALEQAELDELMREAQETLLELSKPHVDVVPVTAP